MTDYLKYLPVDNGDTILIKAGDDTVITDIHYRTSVSDIYDIKNDITESCKNNKLSYFVLTHTDKDHVLGFGELFHCGAPSEHKGAKDERILVKEIVCSNYLLELTNPTEQSKDIVKEIRRRNNLKSDKSIDGNRLRIVEDGDTIEVNSLLTGTVMSPSQTELDASDPKAETDSENNNVSVVIQWSYKQPNGIESLILLGGDAENPVWARLNDEKSTSELSWHVCSAFHHCSLTPFATKDNSRDEYVDNDKAVAALSNKKGSGFVVSSSKEIKRDDDNPPHYKAKNKWKKILDKDSAEADKRFFCTATYGEGNKPAPVVFDLTSKGIKVSGSGSKMNAALPSVGLDRTTKYGK
ncbi:hypothetical protein [Aeromonas veronii]|uniref:hypothetical protein n=1 Tax=Aeromonas veronii TaxID=654 RepID=UPI001F24A8AD|nr:hypothetical protein [Aeromonas veronii]MCF7743023.1 hypothetical protein [Aeromonas veronii]